MTPKLAIAISPDLLYVTTNEMKGTERDGENEDMIAEGDRVVSRWTMRSTHKGEWMGIAPTGKQVMITGISIHRIAGGKIVEDWANADELGMMQQLGAVPPIGESGE